jgi:hypothetical protein
MDMMYLSDFGKIKKIIREFLIINNCLGRGNILRFDIQRRCNNEKPWYSEKTPIVKKL